MKKIINGKRYDTDTAREIGSWEPIANRRDFHWFREELYQKRTGEFFIYGVGNAASKYHRRIEQSTWDGDERLIPLSYDEAREWCEEHLDADEYETIFGEVSEDEGNVVITLSVPAWVAKALKTMAAKSGKTQGEIIASLIPTE